ncbi:MAG TPA: polysaccharide deacetylase family protein [Blastocatellia bacterium]|nr:polysaccharide deacetylase family protein [Blastocatellia bacterium]
MNFFALALMLVPQSAPPPVYVTLWFDTEDYVLPASDDAAKRVAEMLTRLGVRATFKVVGEKARTLERRGRRDVIAALGRHEIGYHADTHSQQPTIAVYLRDAGWEDGAAEFARREGQGVKDIERIFGVTPVCYGQPGAAWAPQSYPALRQMGIGMYLDEGNHVGLGDQPFYYAGMLNVFKMGPNVARMDLEGESNLARGRARFEEAAARQRAAGGGTVSIYYHPCEWVHREFWDGVNFARGRNPPREEWRLPPVKTEAESERAYRDFEEYVKFIKGQPGVRFVTAGDLMRLYADRAAERGFDRAALLALARDVQREISFRQLDGVSLSGADAFWLLTAALDAYLEEKEVPAAVRLRTIYGPARPFAPGSMPRPEAISWADFARAARDVAAFCRERGRMPDEVWVGAQSLAPADFLATLGAALEALLEAGRAPERVTVREGKMTAGRYVAEDSAKLWGWVIFPENFRAPRIMELGRLQAWTLKPALLGRE